MTELIIVCIVLALVQSLFTIVLPIYDQYRFHGDAAPTGWGSPARIVKSDATLNLSSAPPLTKNPAPSH